MNRPRPIRILAAILATLATVLPCAAAEPGRVATPFNGKNLDGWTVKGPVEKSHWTVGIAATDPNNPAALRVEPAGDQSGDLVNAQARGLDFYTVENFGDCTVELEFMVPKGSNSGIYLMGEYEVQILDSYGKARVGPGDLGGLYGAQAPRINAAKAPGTWQKFQIEFQAPKFADGAKVANARFVKIALNGEVVQAGVEMKGPTPGGVTGREAPEGPLMFQGNHGPVAFRNIRITLPPQK